MPKKIIVGIDFSESSKLALERAWTLANKLDAQLIAMHVLQEPAPMVPDAQIPLPDKTWLDTMEGHAREHLQNMVKNYSGTSIVVRWGSPAERLVQEADKDCMLVVAQVGHTGLSRLLFGSTAARVVKHSPCDVLVVRGNR